MAPAILDTIENAFEPSEFPKSEVASAVIHRSLKSAPLQVIRAEGTKVTFSNGQTINDTTCGAAVACLGYHNERVKKAMIAQIEKFSYCNSMFFGTEIGEQLAEALVEGTRGEMAKALVMCSGSEAMDAAMKMARQGRLEGQSQEEYVARLAKELDDKFRELGAEEVIAFVAEPVVGAALGAVPAVPGYFKAMREVCDKYGALLILDAALEVQKIIAEDKLVDNVREVGAYFGELLHAYLDDHPHIGNVRGKGFFWGVEFVKDKITKTPFPKSLAVANTIFDVGMGPEYGISLYPGQGSVDGVVGDHVLIAPAYGTTREEIKVIAELTRDVIFKALSEFS
ncbi:putative Uncharacterized aminotransferase [Glarea lozoyensis 74030]|uniref:Putative Uncharacterized aminotransferase n=1 Tax=Glarea lozoyensis (strain ATCC 74030 / MF5533) TaxID=1104152 RepID=H0ETC0_GLAL7|nr:putative Uncharacterized aminotransferase [Glarea lozoyensis 74030]